MNITYKLENIDNSIPLVVVVTIGDDIYDFSLEHMVKKRNKDSLRLNPFTLVNEYIKWRDDKWRTKFATLFDEVDNLTTEVAAYPSFTSLPVDMFHKLITHIDIKKLETFIRETEFVQCDFLVPKLTKEALEAGRADEALAHSAEHYYDAAAMLTMFKLIYPLLVNLYNCRRNDFGKGKAGMLLLMNRTVFNYPNFKEWKGVKKLYAMVNKIISSAENEDTNSRLRAIELSIAMSALPDYLIAVYMLTKILPMGIIEDNKGKNIVTMTYTTMSNALNLNVSVASAHREKRLEVAGGEADTKAISDSYRSSTKVPLGILEEQNMAVLSAFNNPAIYYPNIPISKEMVDNNYNYILHAFSSDPDMEITDIHFKLLAIFGTQVVYPEIVWALGKDPAESIVLTLKLIAIVSAALTALDNIIQDASNPGKTIGTLLLSKFVEDTEDKVFNAAGYEEPSAELQGVLRLQYKHNKPVKKLKEVTYNLDILTAIEALVDEITGYIVTPPDKGNNAYFKKAFELRDALIKALIAYNDMQVHKTAKELLGGKNE